MNDPWLTYRTTNGQTDNPVRWVVLLYEQAVEDLRRARAAFRTGDVAARTTEIDHALLIIGQLQGSLDMAQGGEVAQSLDRFYDTVRAQVLDAQMRSMPEILDRQIANLLSLREAWAEVELATRRTAPAVAPEATPTPASATLTQNAPDSESRRSGWRA